MTFPDPGIIESLKGVLTKNPEGITISGIAAKTKLNRNLTAKYLDYLLLSGQLEMKKFGSSKVYSLTSRIPVSALIYHAFDPVLMLDHNQRIISTNDPLLALLEEKPENINGKKLSEIHHSVLTDLLRNTLTETSPGHIVKIPGVTISIRGKSCCFDIRTIPVVLEDGKSSNAIILHDITAEKNCQLIQDLDRARQDTLAEDQSEFVIRFSPDGTVIFMNPAASRFFRKSSGNSPGIAIKSIVLLEDQPAFEGLLRTIRKDNPVGTCMCRIIDPAGRIRHFSWVIRGLFGHDMKIHEFQGTGTDITELHASQKKIDQFFSDQWFLTRKACEIIDLPDDADIYQIIGCGIKEILPDAMVVVNSFDPDRRSVTTRCFLGDREREIFSEFIGQDVIGMVVEAPDSSEKSHVIQNLMGGKLIKVPGNLEVMMMGQVPRAICEKIEKTLNIGDMYVLGLSVQNVLFGNICLLLRKGDTIQRNEILEVFIRHASLALKCRYLAKAREIPVPVGKVCPAKLQDS